MPIKEYSEEEAMSLAMLMMSWKSANIPVMLMPTGQAAAVPDEEETVQGELSPFDWGKELFESKMCSECHTIGGGVEIGPDLIGVAEIRGLEWLKKMIQNPEEMERTDSTAQMLYKEYEELGMATEGLSDEEVAAIIVYIRSFDKN
jgi:mono/diheme cytochrome c family protein